MECKRRPLHRRDFCALSPPLPSLSASPCWYALHAHSTSFLLLLLLYCLTLLTYLLTASLLQAAAHNCCSMISNLASSAHLFQYSTASDSMASPTSPTTTLLPNSTVTPTPSPSLSLGRPHSSSSVSLLLLIHTANIIWTWSMLYRPLIIGYLMSASCRETACSPWGSVTTLSHYGMLLLLPLLLESSHQVATNVFFLYLHLKLKAPRLPL